MDLGMSITLNEDYMPYMIAVSLEMSDKPQKSADITSSLNE